MRKWERQRELLRRAALEDAVENKNVAVAVCDGAGVQSLLWRLPMIGCSSDIEAVVLTWRCWYWHVWPMVLDVEEEGE